MTRSGRVDVLIRGGCMIDGSGRPAVRSDVAIAGDRIVGVGPAIDAEAGTVVDADGLVVTPGFSDMHAHADLGLLADGRWRSALDQGVTILVIGQDGLGLAPINDQRQPSGASFAAFTEIPMSSPGHGARLRST